MPEDFPQMQYPFGGVSTDLAKQLGKSPEDMRSYIIGHPGEFSDTEFRSAQRAEQAIRRNARENRELPQHNISKERF